MAEPLPTLDREALAKLRDILSEAIKAGFGTRSSPVELIMELTTDLLLQLANFFQAGGQFRQLNKELVELKEPDVLGNPQLVWRGAAPLKAVVDIEKASYFMKLAQLLVSLKRNPNKPLSVMLKDLGLPETGGNADQKQPAQLPTSSPSKRDARVHYWRRIRRREK